MILTGNELKEELLARGFIVFFLLKGSFRLEDGRELPTENYRDIFNIYQRHVSRLIDEAVYEVQEKSLKELEVRLKLIRDYFHKSVEEYVSSHNPHKLELDSLQKLLNDTEQTIQNILDRVGVSQMEP